jgi:hypothetical protein
MRAMSGNARLAGLVARIDESSDEQLSSSAVIDLRRPHGTCPPHDDEAIAPVSTQTIESAPTQTVGPGSTQTVPQGRAETLA